MPILSVMLGYFFFKERLNKKRVFSILLVVLSILFLIVVSIKYIFPRFGFELMNLNFERRYMPIKIATVPAMV